MPSVPIVLSRRPRLAQMVARDRVVQACAGSTAVMLVAPSGSGKSVVAGQLCDHLGRRPIWCRLAPGYGEAADLVAIAHQSAGADTTAEIDATTDVLTLAGILLELLEAEPCVLVVDDFHEAEGDRCDQLLAEVIGLVHDEATIVVSSRSRPAALIGRLAATAPVVLDADALAFDTIETEALFTEHGRDAVGAAEWADTTGGWAAALALAAEGVIAPSTDPAAGVDLAAALLADARLTNHHELLRGLAVLPYLTGELAGELSLGTADALAQLGSITSLASDADGFWRLHAAVADELAASVEPARASELRAAAATLLADRDPATAIELFLAVRHHEAAADVLADHLSTIGTDHAMRWLYEMPAELRRRFPPALSGGRATVNLDVAIVTAQHAVEQADGPTQRREALFALGSVHAGRGELADAADALEGALRLADAGAAEAAIATQLAMVRWWAGDLDGARAALARSGDGVWPSWIVGQLALLDGDTAALAEAGRRCLDAARAEPGATEAPGRSLMAAASLLDSRAEAATEAAEAYRIALDVGGLDLAAAATIHAWALLGSGRSDDAEAVIDVLQRQVGRQDMHARVQAALLSCARSLESADTEQIERDERRLHQYREAGYAPLEAAAQRLAGSGEAATGLSLQLLGSTTVVVDGVDLPDSAWKSKKAREVLLWLGVRGGSGARREQVIEAIWPGRDPEKGRTLLRTALSEIRRVLEPRRHQGEPSRFVSVEGDRLVVTATADLTEARSGEGSEAQQFSRLAPGLAPDLPDAEWVDELRPEVERLRIEAAERVAGAGGADDPAALVAALEVLYDAEPWNKAHVDALMTAHRSAGDEAAARAVERRWFEDDD